MRLYYATHPKQYKLDWKARCRKLHKMKTLEFTECNFLIDRVGFDTDTQTNDWSLVNTGQKWLCGNCFSQAEKGEIIQLSKANLSR